MAKNKEVSVLVDAVATTAIWIRGKYGQTTATTVVTEAATPIGRRGRGRESLGWSQEINKEFGNVFNKIIEK